MLQYQLLPKPKKRNVLRKIFFIFFVVLFVVSVVFLAWLYLPFKSFAEEGIMFNIEKGQGLSEIAGLLKEKGVVNSGFLFEAAAVFKGAEDRLQAGTYYLTDKTSVSEILDILNRGDVLKDKIRLIEGWGLKDIAWYFESKGLFPAEKFFETAGFPGKEYNFPGAKDFYDKFPFLKEKPESIGLEGYLFPDTYEVRRGETLEDVIVKMLANFDEKISPDLREEIKQQGKTLFGVLTMASILEKEIKNYEDKRIAAGILWKRIKNGWPMQIDATVSYLVGKTSLELTKSDLQIDSRYNTYKYYGLPLGPISNPGLDSIQAAVRYQESPYWFYLNPDSQTTIFSRTLEEHAANKAKYFK